MKQRAIFLFYHGLGHVNAFLKAASILEENNYDVWFAGSGYFKTHITSQHFKFYLLKRYSFGIGLENWVNKTEKKKYIFFRTLWDRINDRMFTERKVELYWMLEELKPTLVFIDKLLSTDFIVLYPHLKDRGIRIAVINTMLPTQIMSGRPPLNSDALPSDHVAIEQAIRKTKLHHIKKKWKQKLLSFGFDDSFIISRSVRKNAVPFRYISVHNDLLNFSIRGVEELILAPHEFDFPGTTLQPNQKYVGFMTANSRLEVEEGGYREIASDIVTKKREKNLKLVYCSFGTVPARQRKAIIMFIRKLAAIAESGRFLFVISGNHGLENRTPANAGCYIFNTVPQLDMLRTADVFITHGGLNSIKEAIHAEVPMLVYPLHPEYDPRGNAARVFYHQLGLRGELSDNIDLITSKIDQLVSNGKYRDNIRLLKERDGVYSTAFMGALDCITPFE